MSTISEERVRELAKPIMTLYGTSEHALDHAIYLQAIRTVASEGYRNGMEKAAEICDEQITYGGAEYQFVALANRIRAEGKE